MLSCTSRTEQNKQGWAWMCSNGFGHTANDGQAGWCVDSELKKELRSCQKQVCARSIFRRDRRDCHPISRGICLSIDLCCQCESPLVSRLYRLPCDYVVENTGEFTWLSRWVKNSTCRMRATLEDSVLSMGMCVAYLESQKRGYCLWNGAQKNTLRGMWHNAFHVVWPKEETCTGPV